MKLQLVPAAQGALWVRRGFGVFFRRPLAFSGLFAGFLFAALLSLMVPLVGPLLLLAGLPLVSLGFMLATRVALEGRFPLPGVFIAPLRGSSARRLALIQLGLVYAGATFLIVSLSEWADGGKFELLQRTLAEGNASREHIDALLADPQLQFGVLLRFVLAALLALPFWHAPALVHWGGLAWAKSLFFSSVACWRNKGAFAVYALCWVAVVLLLGVLANLAAILFGQPQILALATLPAGLMLSTVFYASLYFTFADCFSPADEAL